MSSLGNANDPLLILLLVLAALVVVPLLKKKAPETHVQQASHGGSIAHHHDARVSVVVYGGAAGVSLDSGAVSGRDRHGLTVLRGVCDGWGMSDRWYFPGQERFVEIDRLRKEAFDAQRLAWMSHSIAPSAPPFKPIPKNVTRLPLKKSRFNIPGSETLKYFLKNLCYGIFFMYQPSLIYKSCRVILRSKFY